MGNFPSYTYRGARAMVRLHDQYLREFWDTWKTCKASGVMLPRTDHPGYVSLETLLKHVLGSARHYLIWICEQLELPDPHIHPAPTPDVIEAEAEGYLDHLHRQWRTPLAEIAEERFDTPTYLAEWGTPYSLDSMLEHAVMHPILHRFQLQELLEEYDKATKISAKKGEEHQECAESNTWDRTPARVSTDG